MAAGSFLQLSMVKSPCCFAGASLGITSDGFFDLEELPRYGGISLIPVTQWRGESQSLVASQWLQLITLLFSALPWEVA